MRGGERRNARCIERGYEGEDEKKSQKRERGPHAKGRHYFGPSKTRKL